MSSEQPKRTLAASTRARCGAQKHQGEKGETCTQIAGWGTDHVGEGRCRIHGGNTKSHRVGAAIAIADKEARAILGQLDVKPVGDPFEALLLIAGQAIAWLQAAAQLVQDLDGRIRYEDAKGAEQLRAEVQIVERAMDRVAQILTAINRLKIEDRMARIAEKQAERVLSAIDAALAAAGVSGQQAAEARLTAARHLQAVPDSA
jgi:hypothetical protein